MLHPSTLPSTQRLRLLPTLSSIHRENPNFLSNFSRSSSFLSATSTRHRRLRHFCRPSCSRNSPASVGGDAPAMDAVEEIVVDGFEREHTSVGTGNPSVSRPLAVYRMSLGDQAFFLLSFIACTEFLEPDSVPKSVSRSPTILTCEGERKCRQPNCRGNHLLPSRRSRTVLRSSHTVSADFTCSPVETTHPAKITRGLYDLWRSRDEHAQSPLSPRRSSVTAIAFTSLVIAAVPTLFAMKRAAISLAKLSDTVREELPSTMAAIRLSGMEISDLTLELNDLSQEIADGVHKSAQAVQAAEAGIRHIGALARQQTISMIQERANLPEISLRPMVAGAARKASDAVGHATKKFKNILPGRKKDDEKAISGEA